MPVVLCLIAAATKALVPEAALTVQFTAQGVQPCLHRFFGLQCAQQPFGELGKSDDFTREDLRKRGAMADLKPRETEEILREVEAAAHQWSNFTEEADVPPNLAKGARAGFWFFLSVG